MLNGANSELKKVICICYVFGSTLGDLKTLIVNIRLLQKRYFNKMELHLVVITPKDNQNRIPIIKKFISEEISHDILFFEDILSMTTGGDADQKLVEIHKKFTDSNRIFICPNVHFLCARAYKAISSFNKHTLLSTEYNFDTSLPELWKFCRMGWQETKEHHYKLFPPAFDCFLETGISENSHPRLGIFLSTTELADRPLSNLTTSDGIALKKFFLASQTEEVYHQDHDLYFGYFNQIPQRKPEFESPLQYIRFCLYKSKFKSSNKLKIIDIVLPLRYSSLGQYDFSALKNGSMRDLIDLEAYYFEYYNKLNGEIYHSSINFRGKGQRVRIINPFPLDEQSMLALFKASDPFCLVTGDQSLSEAFSYRKIPFYQTMPWKKSLRCALFASVKSVLGEDSFLNRYFQACEDRNFEETLNLLCENEGKLLESLNQFIDYLYKHENAEDKYIDKLATLILDDAEFVLQVKHQARSQLEEFQYKVKNFSRVYSCEKYDNFLSQLQDVELCQPPVLFQHNAMKQKENSSVLPSSLLITSPTSALPQLSP